MDICQRAIPQSSAAVEMKKIEVKSVHYTLGEKRDFTLEWDGNYGETTDITIPRSFQQVSIFLETAFFTQWYIYDVWTSIR